MRLFSGLFILFALLCFAPPSLAKDLVLVENGKSNARIIIDAGSKAAVRYAAEEFQHYIGKMSGVQLPIIEIGPDAEEPAGGLNVYIGKSAYTDKKGIDPDKLKSDGFVVSATDRDLVLIGRDEPIPFIENRNVSGRYELGVNRELKICGIGQTGSLFAVYHFLQRYCGVLWIWPGELGEVVPKTPTISIPIGDYIVEPDFELRMYYAFNFQKDPEAAKWYRRAGFGSPTDPAHPNHSAHLIYSKQENHVEHPEWFALKSGERHKIALCWSEPSLIDEWARLAQEYFTKHPEAVMFSVMPEDENTICECPRCQAKVDWSPPFDGPNSPVGGNQLLTNLVWPVVNEVAARIGKEFPGKLIGDCAYMFYLSPPNVVQKLEPNVTVMLCAQTSMMWEAGVYGPEIRNFEKGWINKGGILSTWDYLNHHKFSWGISAAHTPIVIPHMLADRYKRLKRISRGGFYQADNGPEGASSTLTHYGMDHVNWYVLGRLSWDLSANVDNLLDEYCSGFFGPAATIMRKFWQIQEDAWRNRQDLVVWQDGLLFRYNHVYSPRILREMFSTLDEARNEAKTANDPNYLKRIDLIAGEYEILRSCLVDEWKGYPKDAIVRNGDFETESEGFADGWHWDNGARLSEEQCLSGQKSLRLDGKEAYALSDIIKLNPANEYLVSVWFKTEGNGNPDVEAACPKLSVLNVSNPENKPATRAEAVPGRVRGTEEKWSAIARPGVDGWQRLYVICKPREYVQIRLRGAQGYTCFYDDVTIEQLPSDWLSKAIGYPSY